MIVLPARRKAPETWARYLWDRVKFHACIALLALPALFLPDYLSRKDAPLPFVPVKGVELVAGPFALTLGESNAARPQAIIGGWMKSYDLQPCAGCIDRIKGVYLRVGKPRNIRAAGALFGGNPFKLTASVQMPPSTSQDSVLWLTIETWAGEIHQAYVPLSTLSPATADFFGQQTRKQGSAE
ncbi:hypothetical protein [Shinella sp. HZN7]|uniref:hypothetical protein n=1 Tax=Shinella sp. (strain HZN7) TaxID=879274 RepID=UPI0007DA9912|nr:hypothetical protein [Shinella sp. HZN7]ANH03412.1 hypothetical protein shn_04775 [Shinella sp. HZN7]